MVFNDKIHGATGPCEVPFQRGNRLLEESKVVQIHVKDNRHRFFPWRCCDRRIATHPFILARWRFYFQIHKGSIKSPQVVEFLRHLQRHIPGRILILWDGAPIHPSLLVKNYIASTRQRIVLERLPAYAPELNPVEHMWGHLKAHEIGNLLATKV
jgi:hypothetical protein